MGRVKTFLEIYHQTSRQVSSPGENLVTDESLGHWGWGFCCHDGQTTDAEPKWRYDDHAPEKGLWFIGEGIWKYSFGDLNLIWILQVTMGTNNF